MKKRNRIIARVLAVLLCVIMVLAAVIPYVSADGETTDSTTSDTLNMITDYLGKISNTGDSENTETSEKIDETTTAPLPDGFEYVDGAIVKSAGNEKTAIALDAIPSDFDQPVVTAFIGNLETYEVQSIDFKYEESYIFSIALEDGYYVIFTNDYAWSDKNGNTYAVNDGEYQYIYVGNDMDEDLYGVEFKVISDTEFFYVEIGTATEDMTIIEYGTTLGVKNSDLKYPDTAKLNKLKSDEKDTDSEYKEPSEKEAEKTKETSTSFFGLLGDFVKSVLKDSYFFIILIVICGVVLYVIRTKKNRELAEQSENDRLDDHLVE